LNFLLLVLLVAGLGIWALLKRREDKRVAAGGTGHSALRLVLATFGALVFLFSGGCGLLFSINLLNDPYGGGGYVGWEIISLLTLPPLAVGALVWWLAMRRKSG
jgi:hypothetical protein